MYRGVAGVRRAVHIYVQRAVHLGAGGDAGRAGAGRQLPHRCPLPRPLPARHRQGMVLPQVFCPLRHSRSHHVAGPHGNHHG